MPGILQEYPKFPQSGNDVYEMRLFFLHELYGFFLNLGGITINTIMNILYNVRIKDQATMFKVFNIGILEGIKLETNHFETEVEFLCKLFKKKIYPLQIPVNYKARSKAEGKKINFFRDGISFLKVLFKYRFFN